MPSRLALYLTAALVMGFTVLYGVLRESAPNTAAEWAAPIGPAVTVSAVALFLFDRYLWRAPGVRHLTGRPLLRGTWHGSLTTNWVDPQTGKVKPPDDNIVLVVRQRYWSLTVRMLTAESRSASLQASLIRDPDGVHRVVYLYDNTPRPEVRLRSQIHYGASVLTAPKRAEEEGLEGSYFTDRETAGEMRLHTRYRKLVETHSAAMSVLRLR